MLLKQGISLPNNVSSQERLPSGMSDSLLRVLLVTARYPPLIGGTEIHTYEVAQRMAAAGHDVTVLTTDSSGALARDEHVDGVRVLRVRAWPAKRDYYFAPGIQDIIKSGDWDIVHCQGYHTFVAPIAMLAARRANIPYVVTFHSGGHSSRMRNAFRPVQRAILRPLLARAERLIGVSRFEVEFFQKHLRLPKELFQIIPNGSYLPVVTHTPTTDVKESLIVSVGRLERYKGHHRVIAALPTIAKHCPDVRLRIIGMGPYQATLWQMAHEAGVADRVEIGVIPGSDRHTMASVLMGAKLVILLSDYESQGVAVMEALALGRPVLVADATALHDLVMEGLVYATSLGSSAHEVAMAVLQQINQPLIPQQVDLPTWDDCTAGLLNLYQTVLQRA